MLFDIKKSIKEIVNIQKYNAERQGISLTTEFHGFRNDFDIVQDQERI
jgi:hypothetical protein